MKEIKDLQSRLRSKVSQYIPHDYTQLKVIVRIQDSTGK